MPTRYRHNTVHLYTDISLEEMHDLTNGCFVVVMCMVLSSSLCSAFHATAGAQPPRHCDQTLLSCAICIMEALHFISMSSIQLFFGLSSLFSNHLVSISGVFLPHLSFWLGFLETDLSFYFYFGVYLHIRTHAHTHTRTHTRTQQGN